jgi:protein-disulfide isomerase
MQDSSNVSPNLTRSGAGKQVAWVVALVVGIALGVVGDRTIGFKIMQPPRPPAPPSVAQQRPRQATEDAKAVYKVPLDDSPVKGPKDALITIVESSDFQCPYCKRVAPTLKQIEDAYRGKVRFVFKHNPLTAIHPLAAPAAEAAEEAREQGGAEKFWAMHDKLFAMEPLSRAGIDQAAKELGLNTAAFAKAVDSSAHQARISRDQSLVTSLGASGTPAFFINGRRVTGARPFENFKSIIDEELVKAEEAVKSGTSASELYAKIVDKGSVKPVYLPGQEPSQQPSQPSQPSGPPPTVVKEVKFRKDDPARGSKNAKVTMVLFSDFQCPFCSRIEPTIKQLEDTYKGDFRVIWKHEPLPFHQNAMPAAEAAEAAREQGKFWQMHDLMFANQNQLSPDQYQAWAKQIGLDMGQFKRSIDEHKNQSRIQEDTTYGASVGANGTPTFYLNCVQMVGAQPYDMVKNAVDEELKKADALIKKGLAVNDSFYERACQENLKNPSPSAQR